MVSIIKTFPVVQDIWRWKKGLTDRLLQPPTATSAGGTK